MDEINAHRLRVNYGPHLVRVTRQDMQAWMPEVRPAKPLAIDPDPALGDLLDAIRRGGREAYRRLLEVLRELKTLEAGTALFKQALVELSRAQGVVLGNIGVYVDASVDPETLTHSQAALVRQGIVTDAMRGGGDGLPLLRGITAQTLAGVAAEEQVMCSPSASGACASSLARSPNVTGCKRTSPTAGSSRTNSRCSSTGSPAASSRSCVCPESGPRATTSKTRR